MDKDRKTGKFYILGGALSGECRTGLDRIAKRETFIYVCVPGLRGGASVGMRGGLHLGIGPTSCDPRSVANDLGLTNSSTSYLTDRHRPSQVRIVAIPCRETDWTRQGFAI